MSTSSDFVYPVYDLLLAPNDFWIIWLSYHFNYEA